MCNIITFFRNTVFSHLTIYYILTHCTNCFEDYNNRYLYLNLNIRNDSHQSWQVTVCDLFPLTLLTSPAHSRKSSRPRRYDHKQWHHARRLKKAKWATTTFIVIKQFVWASHSPSMEWGECRSLSGRPHRIGPWNLHSGSTCMNYRAL